VNDLRVGKDDPGLRILADREVDRRDSKIDPDLRSCEAEPGRPPSGFEEILHQDPELVVEGLDRSVLRLETRVTVNEDRMDGHSSVGEVPGSSAEASAP
jgi:hypothetical protein